MKSESFERKVEVPKQEIADMKEYAMNPRRYQNALIESKEGLPTSLLELDEVSVLQMMNYISKDVCDYTGESMYLNKVSSFINSGAYPSSYLEKVFGKKYITKKRNKVSKTVLDESLGSFEEISEEQEISYYIRNRQEYAKIEIDALQNWTNKNLGAIFQEYLVFNYGELTKEVISQALLSGVLNSKDETTRLRYIKESMNLLGLNKGSNNLTQVNVSTEGGGSGLGKKLAKNTGNDNFVLIDDDDD